MSNAAMSSIFTQLFFFMKEKQHLNLLTLNFDLPHKVFFSFEGFKNSKL
jgi:hypothetical protein